MPPYSGVIADEFKSVRCAYAAIIYPLVVLTILLCHLVLLVVRQVAAHPFLASLVLALFLVRLLVLVLLDGLWLVGLSV
jgi:hypothetical protein